MKSLGPGDNGEPIRRASDNSNRIRRHKTANDDAAAVMHVPHHGLTDWIATVADDRPLGYRQPPSLDWNPIGPFAKIIIGAVTVGDVAAGNAIRRCYGLEPGADIGRYVVVLSAIEG